MDELPCCWNHVPHWVNLEFGNLRRFLGSGTYLVPDDLRHYVHDGIVHVFLYKVAPRSRKRRNAIDLRLPIDTAVVAADLAASLGQRTLAESILLAMPG